MYSDGTVVVDAGKRSTLNLPVLNGLVSTVRKDLGGMPATVKPSDGRTIPDIPITVLGILQADGTYQIVRASGLQQLGQEGGYPAPLYDAFTKLNALTTTPSTAYIGANVRYQLQCPATATGAQPWPVGLPQPANSAGASCVEFHVAGGAAATAVRTACVPFMPQSGDAMKTPVPYQSAKGVRTCTWRYALPDETS
ncbi:hypothetical protein GCM10009839_73320 [Catenulispora yoronensis]|uniref:Uncharacterized protein n=1 Tax=Catenulispora yoronensis TaxID=450799 RepID=A0ABP5GR79_9ACTN